MRLTYEVWTRVRSDNICIKRQKDRWETNTVTHRIDRDKEQIEMYSDEGDIFKSVLPVSVAEEEVVVRRSRYYSQNHDDSQIRGIRLHESAEIQVAVR